MTKKEYQNLIDNHVGDCIEIIDNNYNTYHIKGALYKKSNRELYILNNDHNGMPTHIQGVSYLHAWTLGQIDNPYPNQVQIINIWD